MSSVTILDSVTRRLAGWHQRYMRGVNFMYIVAVVIGVLTGACAALLKWSISAVRDFFLGIFNVSEGNYGFFILPVAGILLAVLVTRYVVRRPMDHATDRLIDGMKNNDNDISPRLIAGPIVACSITLGMGGSAGGEDPIAYTGAAIGSNVGKAFRLRQSDLAQLAGCGAAAGIAGIFMAPVGGVMYCLEVLAMRESLQSVIAVIFSSLASALTCFLIMGCHNDVTFMPVMTFEASMLPYVLLCGVVCGIYSAYYSTVMGRCYKWLKRYSGVWVKALAGGAFVSAVLFIFPSLYGEGYTMMAKLMADSPQALVAYGPLYRLSERPDILLALLGVLLLVKPFAVSATNDTGGVGGDFTPTFFCGAICGFIFAGVMNVCFDAHLSYAMFAFLGMAAVMSGAIQAPLMGIFIAAEMAGLYSFILPLTVAAVTSFLTSYAFTRLRRPLGYLHGGK